MPHPPGAVRVCDARPTGEGVKGAPQDSEIEGGRRAIGVLLHRTGDPQLFDAPRPRPRARRRTTCHWGFVLGGLPAWVRSDARLHRLRRRQDPPEAGQFRLRRGDDHLPGRHGRLPRPLPHTTGAVLYPTTTQAAAAEAFLTAHRGHIGLITVSIGGNDVTACAAQANPISCVGTAVTGITDNVTALAAALRAAAGTPGPAHRSHLPRRHPRGLRLPVTTADRLAALTGEALRGGVQGADQPRTGQGVFIRRRERSWTSRLRRARTLR